MPLLETLCVEDRIQQRFTSVKLPNICKDENRGINDCCCEYLVLGSKNGSPYESDVTSAWVKLSSPSDQCGFKLFKDGNSSAYQPTLMQFVNDSNAFYCTIDWSDVLGIDGVGCYELQVYYEIAGIQSAWSWGHYKLNYFSIENALNTAKVRAEFDGYHEIEGIDFTGSGIVNDLRFYGYIGNRQPNMEIDNIIYQNREMKRVIRENINSWEIITDPCHKCITSPMVDLMLLSENNLYISDYNAHNHDYCLKNLPVIVKESPKFEYFDFSRKARVTCVVEDKFKDNRTYY